ncbi:hypothetical protein Scep_026443 [Stephania cephalantha]|uniref:Uncharacterized protein n=1 Tax=Stephania cephalantha TaxID=152367 RepID=A0AAP0EU12_9MAGN
MMDSIPSYFSALEDLLSISNSRWSSEAAQMMILTLDKYRKLKHRAAGDGKSVLQLRSMSNCLPFKHNFGAGIAKSFKTAV